MDDEPIFSEEQKAILRLKQAELIRILDAIVKVSGSNEWQTLKEIIFDKSIASIEKQILNEALSKKIDTDKLYKLQGEWAWAKQYSDMEKFGATLKIQLEEIKIKLS